MIGIGEFWNVWRAVVGSRWIGLIMRCFVQVARGLPAGFFDRVFLLVQQAEMKSEMRGGSEKMLWVLGRLYDDFPEVGTDVMRRVVENVLGVVQSK